MNKRLSLLSAIATLLMCCSGQNALAQETAKLTIHVSNFKNSNGIAIVNIFREQDDIPKKAFISCTATIANGKAEIMVNDLAKGNYSGYCFP